MRLFRTVRFSPALSRIATFVGGAIAIVWLLLTGAGLTAAAIVTGDKSPAHSSILNRSEQIARSEKYLLPPNAEMTAPEAGAILHRITYAGLSEDDIERYRVRPIADHLPYTPPDSTMAMPSLTQARAHPIASALLARIPPAIDLAQAHHNVRARTTLPDGADLIARLAGARRIDLLGARLPSPLPSHLTIYEMPFVRALAWREISYVRKADIARAIAEDRLADADRMSREMITIAFFWHREAPSYMEVLAIGALHDAGLEGLAATASARGNAALADEIRASFEKRAEVHPLLKEPETWSDRVMALRTSRLLKIAQDPEVPRAIAVEYTMLHHLIRPCFVFPLFSVRPPLSETLRPHLVHYESEAVWFKKLTAQQPSRSILDWPEKAYECAQLLGRAWF